jgi:DNA-binding PadR family transcriptional regulator
MDVRTLCLGLLCYGEACGYDLKKRFETDLRHFYTAGFGSIYPALAELADAGLVSCRAIPQDGKPDRKVYRITEAGREEFLHVLRTANPQHKLRSEFLATVYFAELIAPERLQSLLNARLHQLREVVTQVEALARARDAGAQPGACFVAGFGAAVAKAAADYIDANRHLLDGEPRQRARNARKSKSTNRTHVESLI